MPRAPKKCGNRACQNRVIGRIYCPEHEAERQRLMARRRPGTTARGYDTQHRADRLAWEPAVATGQVPCRRCQQPIEVGQAWHMGHDDTDRTLPALPEHTSCNVTAGGMTTRTTRGM